MKTAKMLTILVVALGLMVCSSKVSGQIPLDTAFTYQGCLKEFGERAQGDYDFQFALYDDFDDLDPDVGQEVCEPVGVNDVSVVDSHFVVQVDFGAGVFTGDARWLEIRVRQAGTGNFTTLEPRQQLTLTPYAIYALDANDANTVDGFDAGNGPNQVAVSNGTVCTNLNADMLDGFHLWDLDGRYVEEDQPDSITSAMIQDGTIQFADMGQNGAASGQVMKWNGSAWAAANDDVGPGVPPGVIVMWAGSIASIPGGWALCDGGVHNGVQTPDLRNSFIVGAGSGYSIGNTGGEALHTLTIAEMPSHTHEESGHGGWPGCACGGDPVGAQTKVQTGPAGGGQPHENRPPYYALAYIMRLP